MKIEANWIRAYIREWRGFRVAPQIQLADEEEISIQASRFHYCLPREGKVEWTHVECGFPTFNPGEAMMEYAEDAENPRGTVYPYVPIEVVVDEINAHGGVIDD